MPSLEREPKRSKATAITATTLPPDLAGAAAIYLEAKRKYERAWVGEIYLQSFHLAGLREINEASTAILEIVERYAIAEAAR